MSAPAPLHACPHCGAPVRRALNCAGCRGVHVASSSAVVHPTSRYEDDSAAQMVVGLYQGMTLEQVAEYMGVTRERVRQIQARALHNLRAALALAGVRERDVLAMLAAKFSADEPMSDLGRAPAGYGGTSQGEAAAREGAWSEHGRRVEAALDAAELAVYRAQVAAGVAT